MLPYYGGVHQHSAFVGCGEGIDEHDGVVETEGAHHVVAVERTATVVEILVCDEQTAVGTVDILNDILVSSIFQLVYDSDAIACVKITDAFAVSFRLRTDAVVNSKVEEQAFNIYPFRLRFKGSKRGQQPDAILLINERDGKGQLRHAIVFCIVLHSSFFTLHFSHSSGLMAW